MYREREELFICTVLGNRIQWEVFLLVMLTGPYNCVKLSYLTGHFCCLREIFSFVHPFVQSLIHQVFTISVLCHHWGCRDESAATLEELANREKWGPEVGQR